MNQKPTLKFMTFFNSKSKTNFRKIPFILLILLPGISYTQGWNVGPGGNDSLNGQSPQVGPAEPEILWEGSLTSAFSQQSVCDGNYLAMVRTLDINDVLNATKLVVHNL